jgi:hypothetical protein
LSRRSQGFGRCGAVTPALSGSAPILQVEAVEIGQREIENEAARRVDPPMREEFPGGGENLDLPAGEADQRLQRFAHRDVIIHDEHDGGRRWHG